MNQSKIRKLSKNPYYGRLFRYVLSLGMKREAVSIANHFEEYFRAEVAGNEDDRSFVQNIRHKVYCEELKFEPERPDKRETDEFDDISEYCILRHVKTDRYVGCVRMVAPTAKDDLLPIEKYCKFSITKPEYDPSQFERHTIGEISRLAVLPDFRRRRVDKFKGVETGSIDAHTYSEEEFRCFPFISVGLYFAVAALTIIAKRKHIYVMTEPRIARSMSLAGIRFIQIGDVVDYHGLRAPYYINKDILFKHMSKGLKRLFLHIESDVERSIGKN